MLTTPRCTDATSILLLERGIGAGGGLMLPCGAAVGLSCSSLWTAMRLYVKRLSLTFDAALGSDAPAGGSLGNFNGLAEGGATLGTLGAMLGSSVLMQRFGPRRQIICTMAMLSRSVALPSR